MVELSRVEVVVFDGISWSVNLQVGKARNLLERVDLNVHRQGRAESVEIHLVGVLTLWLKEEHVLVSVGEGVEFGLDARAVARSDALNLSIEKGRVVESASKNLVHFLVGVADPARELLELSLFAEVREGAVFGIAVLAFHQ